MSSDMKPLRVGAEKFSRHCSRWITSAISGRRVEITRNGKHVATIYGAFDPADPEVVLDAIVDLSARVSALERETARLKPDP